MHSFPDFTLSLGRLGAPCSDGSGAVITSAFLHFSVGRHRKAPGAKLEFCNLLLIDTAPQYECIAMQCAIQYTYALYHVISPPGRAGSTGRTTNRWQGTRRHRHSSSIREGPRRPQGSRRLLRPRQPPPLPEANRRCRR